MASSKAEAGREPNRRAGAPHCGGWSPPALLLLGLVAQAGSHLALPLAQVVQWPWTLVGLGPLVVGIWAMVAGDARFKRAGTPVSGQSPPTTLVTDGIFRWSRNPMYGGMLLLLGGVALLLGSITPWIVPSILARVLVVRFIRPEEAVLQARFPEGYEDYADRVSRWISIPGWRGRAS